MPGAAVPPTIKGAGMRTPFWLTSPRAATALAVTGAMLAAGLAALPAGAATDTATITYRGVSVTVPASWPVVRLDGQPGCVRFDQHAVYLGDPATSTCPAHVIGHVESVHLTDGVVSDARSPLATVGGGREITGGTSIHPDLVVTDAKSPVRVVVTAGETQTIARAVADSVTFADTGAQRKTFSVKSSSSADSAGSVGSVHSSAATAPAARAAGPATYTGLGFDACVTPSTTTMSAWGASPYRAVNMYVGGASRGCPTQPNLTASWVTTVVGKGWTLIPTYVGLQASCSVYTHRITKGKEAAQGTASADDAVAILKSLGLGAGSIVYFDLEAYDYTKKKCVAKAQKFLDAWTVRLHAHNYLSGFYTSSNTMKATLVDKIGSATFHQPDDIWFARWNNDTSVLGDPVIPDTAWPTHQRMHQYRGGHNETYGGQTINIDNDSVDADTSPGAPLPEGTFVRMSGTTTVYRIAGGAPVFVQAWAPFGGAQPVVTVSKTRFRLLPTYPRTGTFLQAAGGSTVYRVQSGVASHISSWAAFGGAQPTTSVDPAALMKAGSGGVWNHLISARPSMSMTGPGTLVTTHGSGAATWAAPILSSAVHNYDLRYRASRWNATFGGWSTPKSWKHVHATSQSVHLKRGYDYCLSVRARNWAGQLTSWSTRRCLTRPLDDRSLSASSGWHRGTGSDFFAHTVTKTKQQGATLRVSSARVRRVGIVATTCASCGKVAVIVGGERIATINLSSPTTQRRTLLMLPRFSKRLGDVVLKVKSSGLRVQIDGLSLSRT
jgi:Domain of unknown function (DUF1906)